jgi:DNA-binding IclR family transcriptional regulator
LSIDQVAGRLGVHRSIVYRIVRTLEDHHLVTRDGGGLLAPGPGLAALAGSVESALQSVATPELYTLANEVAMTAFLVVRDGEEAVTVLSIEPRHSVAHVVYRPGGRHPVTRGAPGIALLAGAPPVAGERPEVALARDRGWASSEAEVLPGMSAVAAPITTPRGVVAACSVVFVRTGQDEQELGKAVRRAAEAIARALR